MTASEMHKEFSIIMNNIEKEYPELIYHITYEEWIRINLFFNRLIINL